MSTTRLSPGRRRWVCALSIALAACASDQDKSAAVAAVNRAFQADYESMLADKGVRTYKVRRTDAFVALHAALGKLGMRIADQDPDIGTLAAEAPAPRPLNAQEWRQTADADLPRMREIARPHVGMLAELIRFEPEGLEIVIYATVLDAGGGSSEVSLTTRMRETAPPRTNMPRREYPPPTAVRLALDKIWRQFEQELRAARKLP
ncbi:hypothetical protein [Ramlibacter sp. 2FC]|uniref:hypothetical protein n=1 Tax=Ramlibacter sp. 2FC TaxID=2502188 RepID=UPI0010F6AEC6|nr:hypothetical protein [Ramlibacter sp. 2FC]